MNVMDTQDVALEKPKVLVVDDSQVMRKAIQRILARDFVLIEAEDGNAAWQIICQDHAIQVVFADLMMPNKNGFQLLRDIRESVHARISRLPVIIMTGHEDDEKMRRQAMTLGASDFISKPFDSIQLKARASVHFKADDTSRQLEQAHELLAKRSTIDPLTGLANQRYLQEHGSTLLAFAARQHAELALLCIEVDKFDLLFKKKGRQIAEKVLVHISQAISGCVRKEDAIARVGLARFMVLMPGADSLSAIKASERIQRTIGATVYRLGDKRFRLTASAALLTGVSRQALRLQEVVKLAEEKLAEAIGSGGNLLLVQELVQMDHGMDSASPTVSGSLTLEEALELLNAGRRAEVDNHLPALFTQLYPLLAYGSERFRLGFENGLALLQARTLAA